MIEGKGGGKPDMAQAGGNKAEGVRPALKMVREIVEKMIG
jgi:alanyl-tRNA synthetase